MDFPGRDWWFMVVVSLLVVPVQVALVPVAKLFGQIGIFETTFGVIVFHVAFGLPFAIFLLRNFFAEIPRNCSKRPGSTARARSGSSPGS